jgi:hypothetical protein
MAASSKGSWKAVAVQPGESVCAAAKELSKKRFLPGNAPRLPLPDCTIQDRCQCKYRHYGDRRGEQRRLGSERALLASNPKAPAQERRRPGERRERKH